MGTLAIFSPESWVLEYIPLPIYETFGVKVMKDVKEVYTVKWPLLYMIVGIGLATIVCGFLLYLASARFRMREFWPTEE